MLLIKLLSMRITKINVGTKKYKTYLHYQKLQILKIWDIIQNKLDNYI